MIYPFLILEVTQNFDDSHLRHEIIFTYNFFLKVNNFNIVGKTQVHKTVYKRKHLIMDEKWK